VVIENPLLLYREKFFNVNALRQHGKHMYAT